MASTRVARRPDVRRARAPAIAVRAPLRIPARQPPTLHETLVDAGIMPRSHARGTHGLVWRWFAYESMPLAVGNAAASAVLLLLALTMTAVGMEIAVALNAAATLYVVLDDALPYAGLALLAFAALKAVHAYFDRRAHTASRVLGFALAAAMAAAGLWLEVMLGYADVVPWMLKPVVALAGGEATARIAAFNRPVVSYFEPALAGAAALLLGAKQSKSALTRHAPSRASGSRWADWCEPVRGGDRGAGGVPPLHRRGRARRDGLRHRRRYARRAPTAPMARCSRRACSAMCRACTAGATIRWSRASSGVTRASTSR